MNRPDWIIVGAGVAGCTLARQLSSRSGHRVTIIEPSVAPDTDLPPTIDQQRPSRWLKLMGSSDDWNLSTDPSEHLAGRKIVWPRGRGIGGSGRINAMIWFPPTESDFASWESASGGRRLIGQWRQAYQAAESIACPESPRWISEASRRFLSVAETLPDAEPMIYQRINRNGRRLDWTPMLENTDVVRATVDRVVFKGDRAVGVSIIKDGSRSELTSRCGVIMCAGSIATPTILMRSGIGDARDLSAHGIDVRVDRPTIGHQLKDHLVMPVIFETNFRDNFRLNPSPRDLASWQVMGTGPVASNVAESGGLFRGGDFQVHVTPTHYLTFPADSAKPMMTIAINLTRPKSSGQITISSSDACSQPSIQPKYLSDASDGDRLVSAVNDVRKLVAQSSLSQFITKEVIPGKRRTDERSVRQAIARFSQTLYHPVGSCRLGDQSDTPVDTDFRVRGTGGLWVADASALPELPTGNPTAAVMTWAIMAADSIGASANGVRG
ncbi:MAG: GMC family oxidoreductase [Rubripirellula sp.]